MTLCRRRRSRTYNLFLLFGSCCLVLTCTIFLSRLILKKLSWTAIEWHDEDFTYIQRLGKPDNEIIILRWTKYWQEFYYKSPEFHRAGDDCPTLPHLKANCRYTYDRRYLNQSNAVIFHLWDLQNEEIPPYHPEGQIWVFVNHESPVYEYVDLNAYANQFDWTLTYRKESDLYDPYGWVIPITNNDNKREEQTSLSLFRKHIPIKNKLVAWIVSKCKTPGKREAFVQELKKFIPVDIYGECGDSKCSTSGAHCYMDVAKHYKFYLAFENSLCEDYVTEKFFNSLENNIVPIVYGGADYSSIAPTKSFINARDFKSPKELAEYIMFLDRNDDEYIKYFQWKSHYKVVRGGTWCRLCQKVSDYLEDKSTGMLTRFHNSDLNKWWYHKKLFTSDKIIIKDACEKPPYSSGGWLDNILANVFNK